jgi:hypothetical protein
MSGDEIQRKSLDNDEYLKLRAASQEIFDALSKRLKRHLSILRPLFIPRKLLGTYVRSGIEEEVAGSDKAFAELREQYAAIAQKSFGLSANLQSPLTPIPTQLDAAPFQYSLSLEGSKDQFIDITSSCSWTLSYHGECSLARLRTMVLGSEPRQTDEMKQSIIDHLVLVVFINRFPALSQLLEDLRYQVETRELPELGGLRVVTLKAPIDTFLPPDEFIRQVTQLSGIPAFQEIIDLDGVKNIPDPLRESLAIYTS